MANKDNEDILKKKLSKKKKTVDKKSSLVVYCAVNKDKSATRSEHVGRYLARARSQNVLLGLVA